MAEIFSLQTLCRCCHSDGCFKSLQLSYVYQGTIEVYSTMLQETFGVMITPPPVEASHTICDCCIERLRDAARFRLQVLECERKFEEYCKNEQSLTIKEEADYDSENGGDVGVILDYNDEKYNVKPEANEAVKTDGSKVHVEVKSEKKVVSIEFDHPEIHKTQKNEKIVMKEKTSKSRKPTKESKKNKRPKPENDNDKIPDVEGRIKTKEGSFFTCKLCDERHKKVKYIRKHIEECHKDAYNCRICQKPCSNRPRYILHLATHSPSFRCNVCGKSFALKYSLQEHMNSHTKSDKFQCDICNKFFAYKQTLRKHLLWHAGANKTVICDICGHSFNDRTNLNIHVRSVHLKLRPFKCSYCAKSFSLKKHLKEHQYSHTGDTPYKCGQCNQSFASKWKLSTHERKHENGLTPQSRGKHSAQFYTCKICKERIDGRGSFMRHVRSHIGQKEFKCHMCTKDFSCRYSLNRHINEHSGIRAYACDICSKRFTQQTQLNRHKRNTHDPNKLTQVKIKCTICNKHFRNMEKHIEAHNKRPFSCEWCFKSYPQKNALNRHIQQIHLGNKLFECTLCEKKYLKRMSLTRHSLKVHKVEPKVEESKEAILPEPGSYKLYS